MKVKRMFAKFLATTMAVGMLVGMSGAANDKHVFKYDDKEIAVCSTVDYSKAQSIANAINGEVGISPMGIFCLLGHNLAETTVIETVCKVRPTSPRCNRVTHRITYCTNWLCNYSVGTVISTTSIPHCA